ncbi:MAG: exopolysaccharide biosynthesis polyprenyl glycosylphosphotransferase [Alphaproteobacteria bacterium]|nr:MAG: exopolysaccharide biosynthesis polyprenyl glycosylphosphotransferase [Alphaproteobacteria bacterium]
MRRRCENDFVAPLGVTMEAETTKFSTPPLSTSCDATSRAPRFSTFILLLEATDVATLWSYAIASQSLFRHGGGGHPAVVIIGSGLMALAMVLGFRSLDLYAASRILNLRLSIVPLGFAAVLAGGALTMPVIAQAGVSSGHAMTSAWLSVGCFVILLLNRCICRVAPRLFKLRNPFASTYVVVGLAHEDPAIVETLRRDPRRYRLAGTLLLDERACEAANSLSQMARQRLHRLLAQQPIDAVIIAVPLHLSATIRGIAETARCYPVRVLLSLAETIPQGFGPRSAPLCEVDGHVLAPIVSRPLAGWAWIAKDITDRTLALMLLALIAPGLIIIAISIRCSSPGPVLFRQTRQGYGNRRFEILKFRTMHHRPRSADLGLPLTLTSKNDPRTFTFGRLLRRCSLDELPQLLNVVMGDMWLVGPRPHSPLACASGTPYVEAVEGYAARHRLKPGITGWAQVNGWRGPTDTLEQIVRRVQHDMHYVENWSPLLDLRILLATVRSGFSGENAF